MRNYGWQHEFTDIESMYRDAEIVEECFEDPSVEDILDELWLLNEVRDDVDTYLRMVADEAGESWEDD